MRVMLSDNFANTNLRSGSLGLNLAYEGLLLGIQVGCLTNVAQKQQVRSRIRGFIIVGFTTSSSDIFFIIHGAKTYEGFLSRIIGSIAPSIFFCVSQGSGASVKG
jgi:hypothetical protein